MILFIILHCLKDTQKDKKEEEMKPHTHYNDVARL